MKLFARNSVVGGWSARIVGIFRQAFSEWSEERAPRMAAALAFYTVFSLAPLLILVVAIAGLAFGQEAAQGRIVEQIEGLIGPDGAGTVQGLIENARSPSSGILATIIGVATLLVGASGVFVELQDSLNTIWNVPQEPSLGWIASVKRRFVSFAMVTGVGFLLLVSLAVSAALSGFAEYAGRLFPFLAPWLHVVDFFVSFLGVTVLFALLFKVVPDAEITWRQVWPGAAFTSLCFALGKIAFGFYLGRSAIMSTYGAAASLVVILVWVYYSAQILLFGAELTQVCCRRSGRGREASPAALPSGPRGLRAERGRS
jgi:membrane protein